MKYPVFYNEIRASLFSGSMTQSQVSGIETILIEAEKRNTPLRWLAYMLATTFHETDRTMQPIAEYGKGKGKKYGKKGRYGQIPYGRGDVQLTWDDNYERADKELGLNGALLKNFDLALDPTIAAKIMFVGMEQGWFTGKKLSNYLDGPLPDYPGARRIINGTDKATLIASYANKFSSALIAAGYADGKVTVREQTPVEAPVQAPNVPAQEQKPTVAKYETAPVPQGGWLAALLAILSSFFKGSKP